MSAVMKERVDIEYVRTRLKSWGDYQRNLSGARPMGYCSSASFLSDHFSGCDGVLSQTPEDIEQVELALCGLKLFDLAVYMATSAFYLMGEDDCPAAAASRLRISLATLKNRRLQGEYYVAKALEG